MRWQLFGLVVAMLALQMGCTAVAPLQQGNSTGNEPPVKQLTSDLPVTMAVIWKEAAIEPAASMPIRGFTGRIYFYDQNDNPMKVDGELVVYGFDDNKDQSGNIPDRKYVFPAEKFATHYSESHLGHSYSVWIPWEKHDNIRKSISLVPIFKTADNRIIEGTKGVLMLSGRVSKKDSVEKTYIRQASRESRSAPHTQGPTMTIGDRSPETFQLPPALANRMAEARHIAPEQRVHASRAGREQLDRVQSNPQAARYNQVEIQKSTIQTSAEKPANPTYTNFNDLKPPAGSAENVQAVRPAAFGKPGSFRSAFQVSVVWRQERVSAWGQELPIEKTGYRSNLPGQSPVRLESFASAKMNFASAIQRAAVLVKVLPQQQAGRLLSKLTATDLQEIFRRIRTLGNVTDEQKKAAIRQFLKSAVDIKTRRSNSPPPEKTAQEWESGPFDFLVEAEDSLRFRVLASEHPRVVATVLSLLPASLAATTLNQFESEARVSILRRLCELESIDQEEVARLAVQLHASLKQFSQTKGGQSGGIDQARRMLSCSDPSVRESLLESLQRRDPGLADELRHRLFQFDNLVRLSDQDIRIILKHVDTSLWAPALKHAALSIRKKVLLNMAVRPREILNREMQSIRQIDAYIRSAAEAQIVFECMRLAERDLITLPTEQP